MKLNCIRYSEFSSKSKIKITLFTFVTSLAASVLSAMEGVTNSELADMHLAYGAANGNSREAVRIYAERHPNRYVPSRQTFVALDRRLREHGAFHRPRPERLRRRVGDLDTEEIVLEYFQDNPTSSTRSCARALHLSQSTVWQVLRNNGQHAFHYQRVQSLHDEDFECRVQFARWFRQKTYEEPRFPSQVLFTDESSFTREGICNLHNLHMWSDNNPHVTRQCRFQVRFAVNVWAGILGDNLIGPYILPERLNGRTYYIFLNEVLPELLDNVPLADLRGMYFQHDGCPAHFALNVRQLLDARYPNRWIGRGGPFAWPPRSPDLTPLDYYLWGHMKSLVYETPILSEEDLIGRIVEASERIRETPGVFVRVRQSLQRRLDACIRTNGRTFEQLL